MHPAAKHRRSASLTSHMLRATLAPSWGKPGNTTNTLWGVVITWAMGSGGSPAAQRHERASHCMSPDWAKIKTHGIKNRFH